MNTANLPGEGVEPEDRAIKIGEKYALHSEILNEERPYWVYLPPSYDNKWFAAKGYPVLYLLDGDAHFHSANGVAHFMGAEFQIPELIIVAITNTNRTRDLTPTNSTKDIDGNEAPMFASSGGGETFLQFLNEELIPHIETSYRTIPYRILVGHSFGGLLAMACFLRWPSVFQAYIAIDPSLWWDDEVLLRNAREVLPKATDLHNTVYISLANNLSGDADTKPSKYGRSCRDFADLLNVNPSPGLRTRLEYFGSEDHGSVPLISLFKGLLSIFEDFKAPIGSLFDPPSSISPEGYNAARIKAHFQRISERLGIELLPPEGFLNNIGWQMLEIYSLGKAIECLKLNVSNYPTSYNAYFRLAGAYAAKGEKQLAIDNYERSLELNPDNHDAKAGLEKVRQS